jgi:two-component system, OmpR family, phosphate regulon response regulator OmpR
VSPPAPPSGLRILLVDDDAELCALLAEYLGRFGFAVTTAGDVEQGLRAFRAAPPDALVLDVMLPGQDGFALLRQVREAGRCPVIMLTARGDVADRVLGLELGADDYLPKPFDPRELAARLQAVLRRARGPGPEDRIRVGSLELDGAGRTATLSGRALPLTTAEWELLALLVRSRGRVLSRDRILDAIRGVEWEAFDRSVDVLVSRLRHKLGDDPKRPTYVQTVWGKGYRFRGEGGE